MQKVKRTMIVPAAVVKIARDLSSAIPSGLGMFVAMYSPSGSDLPATHAVSEGWIDEEFALALESPEYFVQMLSNFGVEMSTEAATGLLNLFIVDLRDAQEVLSEMQLTPCSLISVNTAEALELEQAPGIGSVKALAIIAGRPWSNLADLSSISGISADNTAELANWYSI